MSRSKQQGAVLLLVLILLGVFLVGSAAVVKLVSAASNASGYSSRHDRALSVANKHAAGVREQLISMRTRKLLDGGTAVSYPSPAAGGGKPYAYLAFTDYTPMAGGKMAYLGTSSVIPITETSGTPNDAGFDVRILIERLCYSGGKPAVVDAWGGSDCVAGSTSGGDLNTDLEAATPVLFKATIQVREAGRPYSGYQELEVITESTISMALTT